MQPTAYISRRVALPAGVQPACVVVREGLIAGVHAHDAIPADCRVEDLGDCALLPGLVDTHVHANEPGRTEWEGFRTITRAAAAGGVTTLMDMPLNCLPETTTVAALEAKRAAAAGQCHVDWRPWGGAVNGNQAELAALAEAGVPGFKCFLLYPGCDGFGLIDGDDLRRAMPEIARTGLPLLVHAELAGPIAQAATALNAADWRRYSTYLASRPDAAELEAIRLMIDLCRESGARVHIVHLATAAALPMLRAARAEGLPLTVETCPHYLAFSAEDIPVGRTEYKCAPPIRSAANRELLWQALAAGDIDLVASDHSPCPPAMKDPDGLGSFLTAWGGIASVSLGLPVVWTGMRERGLGLELLVRAMAERPAALAGITASKGALKAGTDADLVVFDPEAEWVVAAADLHFRHAVSPYLGQRLTGRVERTLLRGAEVYRRGQRFVEARGREVRP